MVTRAALAQKVVFGRVWAHDEIKRDGWSFDPGLNRKATDSDFQEG